MESGANRFPGENRFGGNESSGVGSNQICNLLPMITNHVPFYNNHIDGVIIGLKVSLLFTLALLLMLMNLRMMRQN